jgi:hypothetical protein
MKRADSNSPYSSSSHRPYASVPSVNLAHLEGVVLEDVQLCDLVTVAERLS